MTQDDSHGHSSGHDFHSDSDDDFHDHDSHGGFHGHDFHGHGFRHRRRRGRVDLSTAPPWVKVFAWVGALTALAGMALIFASVIGGSTSPRPEFGTVSGDSFPGENFPGEGFPGGSLPGENFPAEGFPGGARVTVDGQVFDLDNDRVLTPAQDSRAAGPAERTGTTGLGIGLFFVGFVLSAIAALGHSTSKRR